jgi:putative DNA primase/helicase
VSDIKKKVQQRVKEVEALIGNAEDRFVNGPPPQEFVLDCLHHRERGDGSLYAYMQKGKYIFNNISGEWYRWADHYWQADRDHAYMDSVEEVALAYETTAQKLWEDIKALKAIEAEKGLWCDDEQGKDSPAVTKLKNLQAELRERAGRLRGNNRVRNCVSFAERIQDPALKLSVNGEHFDTNPWLLACPNGVINLRTGEFKKGRQDDYITKVCPTPFLGFDAECREWKKTLLEIFDGDEEVVKYIQRLFGYGITGSVREHIFPVFQGRGRNGKGMIIEVLQHVFGPLVATIRSEMLLAQPMAKNSSAPSPDIMALKGLRIAIASEVDEKAAFSSGQVKLLTGGDILSARNPHDKYQTNFNPSHLLLLLTNDKPRAPDHDFAFWDRMHMVKFPLSFVKNPQSDHERKREEGLAERLKKEASGILAWAVQGSMDYQADPLGLNPPKSVVVATKEYQKEEDLLGAFIEECCVLNENIITGSSDLYGEYKEWHIKTRGRFHKSQKWFGTRMKDRFEKVERSGNNPIRYKGIGLKTPVDEDKPDWAG